MKKIYLMILIVPMILLLGGCRSIRERILAAPDEMTIPEGSSVAVCVVDEIEYKHIYQNDGIYKYFINDVLQDENDLDVIQEQAYLHGESVENYLIDEYGIDGCIIEDYVEETKD